jgi:hypothetical protein
MYSNKILNIFIILKGKPEGKKPLWRAGRKWENNISMDLEETGQEFVEWTSLAQDKIKWRADVITAVNRRIVHGACNFLSSKIPLSRV